MSVTLEDLVTPATQEDVLAQELLIATDVGLPTTAWQPVQAIPSVLNIQAAITADYSGTAAQFAQGGYASYAALMTDSGGNPITTWLDLRMLDQYGISRQPATFAAGSVPFTSTSPTTYNYAPNSPLHFQNLTTGATYTSRGTGTLTNAGGTVAVQADKVGASSTSGVGVVLALTTPLAGVTITALTASIVGEDAESNSAFLARGQAKLGTVDNLIAGLAATGQPQAVSGSPASAYYYVATSIPQGIQSSSPPYAVSTIITRCVVWLDIFSGDLNVYVANGSGTPSNGDIAVVNNAIQALADVDGQTVNVLGVVAVTVTMQVTLYTLASTGISPSNAITNAEDALAIFASAVPIGGFSTTSANIVPKSQIENVLELANPGTIDIEIGAVTSSVSPGPSLDSFGNPRIGQNGVPTFSASIVVVLV